MAASILFIHDNFPAQFGEFGRWLVGRGWDVAFATMAPAADAAMRILRYRPHREPSPSTHPYAQTFERAALKAQGFARAALAARRKGYRPEIVMAHSGWGAGMFAKDVFPEARFVAYCEWWYSHPGVDVVWLGEASASPEAPILERSRNAPIAMDLSAADAILCPTRFQAERFPALYRDRMTVLHDGVDDRFFSPSPQARASTLGGMLAPDARLVTYATRGLEPHRGFPDFMAAVPEILAADPRIIVAIAGENRVFYGGRAARAVDWRAKALAETAVDPSRVLFLGPLPREAYRDLLRRSDAHVYFTVPFVLSWSMIEAMSTGCACVVSDVAPAREMATNAEVEFCDMRAPPAVAAAVLRLLRDESYAAVKRTAARRRARRLAQSAVFPKKEALLLSLLSPPSTPW